MMFFDPAAVSAVTVSRNALAAGPTVMRPFRSRITMPSCSRCWISWLMSGGHLEADGRFHFLGGDHFDGVPRAAIQEGAVRPLAGALLAADAEHGVHLDAAGGRMLLVGHPIQAIGDRAIRHTSRRTGAARAAFGDNGKLFGPLFGRG